MGKRPASANPNNVIPAKTETINPFSLDGRRTSIRALAPLGAGLPTRKA